MYRYILGYSDLSVVKNKVEAIFLRFPKIQSDKIIKKPVCFLRLQSGFSICR
jgi:hypothetical protein